MGVSCSPTDRVEFVVPRCKVRHPKNVCGGGDVVMLAHTVVVCFFRKDFLQNCCELILFLFVCVFVYRYF